MSARTAKAMRKAEDDKTKDFEARSEALMTELKALSLKYKIDLISTLQYRTEGVLPVITLVDIKDKFGEVTPEMQKIIDEKKDSLIN